MNLDTALAVLVHFADPRFLPTPHYRSRLQRELVRRAREIIAGEATLAAETLKRAVPKLDGGAP